MIELGDQYLASHLYHSGESKIMKFGSNHVQDKSHGKPHFKKESNKIVTNAIKRGILQQIVSFNLLGKRKDSYPRKKDMSSLTQNLQCTERKI